jgi:hypothetical protein
MGGPSTFVRVAAHVRPGDLDLWCVTSAGPVRSRVDQVGVAVTVPSAHPTKVQPCAILDE